MRTTLRTCAPLLFGLLAVVGACDPELAAESADDHAKLPMALAPAPSDAIRRAFARPVISRAFEQQQWVLRDPVTHEPRQDVASAASIIAGLRPSYISGLVYVQNGTTLTPAMIEGYAAIRAAARAVDPAVRVDVEMSLNPSPPPPRLPFASAADLVAQMAAVDAALHPDAWWFDFYSDAQRVRPEWIAAAVQYAHSHGQWIGGNVFGSVIPPGSDFAAFVDKAADGPFGFDFQPAQIAALQASSPSTLLVGHLQSNAQNGEATESCTYMNEWDEPTRANYLHHWASSQASLHFRFLYPVFYPLCPGAIAFDPTFDQGPVHTLYQRVGGMMAHYNP